MQAERLATQQERERKEHEAQKANLNPNLYSNDGERVAVFANPLAPRAADTLPERSARDERHHKLCQPLLIATNRMIEAQTQMVLEQENLLNSIDNRLKKSSKSSQSEDAEILESDHQNDELSIVYEKQLSLKQIQDKLQGIPAEQMEKELETGLFHDLEATLEFLKLKLLDNNGLQNQKTYASFLKDLQTLLKIQLEIQKTTLQAAQRQNSVGIAVLDSLLDRSDDSIALREIQERQQMVAGQQRQMELIQQQQLSPKFVNIILASVTNEEANGTLSAAAIANIPGQLTRLVMGNKNSFSDALPPGYKDPLQYSTPCHLLVLYDDHSAGVTYCTVEKGGAITILPIDRQTLRDKKIGLTFGDKFKFELKKNEAGSSIEVTKPTTGFAGIKWGR